MLDVSLLKPDQTSLSPLPDGHFKGLIAVTFFGFLSFASSFGLLVLLSYRLISWMRAGKGSNQFAILIFNLILADVQQSLAFLLNAEWLAGNAINVTSNSCWAQGWFISTGDLSSGVFCLAIGLHTFSTVILNYRLPMPYFLSTVLICWVFVYVASVIPVIMYPHDIYVRAGAWCWINSSYGDLRLWTHYFFIFIAEFGTVFIYASIYFMLNQRIRSSSFSVDEAKKAKQAAKLMVVYPLVYVICTVPLASARMASMSTRMSPSVEVLCFAGSMITSNGWMDVLLYTLTRKIMIFGDEPPEDKIGLETFQIPGVIESRFGTTTIIVAAGGGKGRNKGRGLSRHNSTDHLVSDIHYLRGVKTSTTVEVRTEPLELGDIQELSEIDARKNPSASKERGSFDSKCNDSIEGQEWPKPF
ncbi:hypothetical protein EJ05DRAFT_500834 [Pseudovirgaria hyperparasitica]|uniref:G-protein coupled receptors family 1 profile domain-containing protein n=1 Tax=Pseudovirgaria hyperparasitica TaxID=470096 RepID=A0A6A6W886_9PEZI|nr:uncharacterized protein EJ05DRAFT_500834 [Pseudovirgaria hyperparasitica]KAF2757291.1 hypothetical protein EJ05DRAFT_500834 [Pseudovirgaria hyperparasitica]